MMRFTPFEKEKYPPVQLICNSCPQLHIDFYEIILDDLHSKFSVPNLMPLEEKEAVIQHHLNIIGGKYLLRALKYRKHIENEIMDSMLKFPE